MRTAVDAVDCMVETGAPVFAWLCRLVGARSAERLLAQVYIEVVGGAAGAPDIDESGLLAAAFRLAVAADEDEDDEDEDDPERSVLDRALIELHSVRSRSDADVATVVGVAAADVPAAVAAAERAAQRARPDTSFADIGRAREVWLDDEMRERGREAIRRSAAVTGVASARPADGASPLPTRRRMIAAVTTVVVVALVAVAGVVWVRLDDGDQTAADRSGPRVLGEHRVYVLDDAPDGFSAVAPGPTGDADQPIGQLQIWSDPGATRTEGRWFAVLVAACGAIDHVVTAGATRTDVDGHPGVLTHTPDDVVVLRIQTGTNELTSTTLDVRAHGLSDVQVVRIAASVLLGSAVKDPSELPAPACDASMPAVEIRYDDTFESARDGMTNVYIAPWFSPLADSPSHDGDPQFRVAYQSNDPADPAVVTVTTVRRSPLRDIAAAFLRQDAADPGALVAPTRTLEFDGRRVVVAAESSGGDVVVNVVSWSLGADTVEISSVLPLRRLLPLVASLRGADDAELDELQRAPVARSAVVRVGVVSELDTGGLHSIGSAYTATGETWQAFVEAATGAVHLVLQGTGVDVRLPLTVDANHPVHEFASGSATLLVVALPDSHQEATLVVTVAGVALPPVATTTISGDDTYAFTAFSELGDVVVALVEPGREPQILTP